jgi:hypothetical protein
VPRHSFERQVDRQPETQNEANAHPENWPVNYSKPLLGHFEFYGDVSPFEMIAYPDGGSDNFLFADDSSGIDGERVLSNELLEEPTPRPGPYCLQKCPVSFKHSKAAAIRGSSGEPSARRTVSKNASLAMPPRVGSDMAGQTSQTGPASAPPP